MPDDVEAAAAIRAEVQVEAAAICGLSTAPDAQAPAQDAQVWPQLDAEVEAAASEAEVAADVEAEVAADVEGEVAADVEGEVEAEAAAEVEHDVEAEAGGAAASRPKILDIMEIPTPFGASSHLKKPIEEYSDQTYPDVCPMSKNRATFDRWYQVYSLDTPADTLWILYGHSMVTCRYSMDTLWSLYGYLQILHGYSMDTLWIAHR